MTGTGLRAKVASADGWPVAEAVVTVTDMTGTQVAREQAGADGKVDAPALPKGVYTVIVTAVGFDPVARTAMVPDSGVCELGSITVQRAGDTVLPAAGVWTIDPMHSTINVKVRHLGMATIRGRFAEFSGRIEVADPPTESLVQATIDAASVDTSNKMRDDHLRSKDFLHVEEYPEITFNGNGMTATGPDRWTLGGELTLKGVARPVSLDLRYTGCGDDPWGGQRAGFLASTELRREDFGITYNQVLSAGIDAIGATLQVDLEIEAVKGAELPGL
ncbi:YceI family protein [Sciscionella marina]|uniref:YceI family protein n=1 Tax=Sciscionella marina TaxID=508770 RepID=UPI00035FFA9F|nr:YceI family protein [Sciscionella marina]